MKNCWRILSSMKSKEPLLPPISDLSRDRSSSLKEVKPARKGRSRGPRSASLSLTVT